MWFRFIFGGTQEKLYDWAFGFGICLFSYCEWISFALHLGPTSVAVRINKKTFTNDARFTFVTGNDEVADM